MDPVREKRSGGTNFRRELVSSGFALLLAIILPLYGCEPSHRERPYGYLRLGLIKDLLNKETYVKEAEILVRHDASGFSAMSTLCTKDLSPLEHKWADERNVWASKYTQSTYEWDGKVRTGPATRNLPYFSIKLESSKYGGPLDMLYVTIGDEKPSEWRLAVPQNALEAAQGRTSSVPSDESED